MQAEHILRPRGRGGDFVDVEIGGVGGEDGARLGYRVELAEHLLLDRHVLEHRLDDQVAIGEIGIVGGALELGEPLALGIFASASRA